MALALAVFPVEVLDRITFFLSDTEVLIRLPMCGNHNLTHKLKAGGVTELYNELSSLCYAHIKFAQSLRLSSLIVRDLMHTDQLRNLVHGCPPTLTYLEICSENMDTIFDDDSFDFDSPYTTERHTARKPWIVSSTFPQLETLIFSPEEEIVTLGDKIFWTKFLHGLPLSLTKFSPSRKCSADIDLWPHLPGDLVHLGPISICPSFTVPDLPSLRSLDIHLCPPRQQPNFFPMDEMEVDEDEQSGKKRLPREFDPQLVLPSELTRLTASIKHIGSFSSYPATLTSLDLDFSRQVSLPNVLASLPTTLLHMALTLYGMDDSSGAKLSSLKPFTTLKSFSLGASRSRFDVPSDCGTMAELLLLIPHVEELSLKLDHFGPLKPSHLSLLNARIYSLTAPIFPTCFGGAPVTTKKAASSTPIALALPKLRKLKLYSFDYEDADDTGADDGEKMIAPPFANIPLTVTNLRSDIPYFPSDTLHLLPRKVQSLKTHVVVRYNDNLDSLFNDPRTPKPAGHSGKLHTLEVSHRYSMERLNPKLNGDRKSNVLLVPCKEKTPSTINLQWDDLERFPSSLTSLIIKDDITFSPVILASAITPQALPHIRVLHLGSNELPKRLDLGPFRLLASLQLASITDAIESACPPHLTELISEDTMELPRRWIPLPRSITHLEGASAIVPLSELAKLPKLKILKGKNRFGYGIATTPLFPPGLTHLDLAAYAVGYPENLGALRDRCPSLQHIGINGATDAADLAKVQEHFPKATLKATMVDVSHCGLIASRAGLQPHSVTMPDGLPLTEWALAKMKSAFPQREALITAYRNSMDWHQLVSFCDFLTPDTKYLEFFIQGKVPSDLLPRNLTRLNIGTGTSFTCSSASNLPPTLKIFALHHNIDLPAISLLPRGLEMITLDGPNWNDDEPLPALEWPPSLAVLCLSNVHQPTRSHLFKSLPNSLRLLEIASNVTLTELQLLPSSLRYFKCIFNRNMPDFFRYLKSKQITILTERADGRD